MQSQAKRIPQRYFSTDKSISLQNFSVYKKRFPKYLNSLKILRLDLKTLGMSYLRNIKRVKRIQSLSLEQKSVQNPYEYLALIKPFKKCLKNISGFHQKYYKHLPKITQASLDIKRPESYKALSFYQRLEDLSLILENNSSKNLLLQLIKNKRKLERYFSKIRSLQSLHIISFAQGFDPLFEVLRLLGAFPKIIKSLKAFTLKINCHTLQCGVNQIPLTAFNSLSCLAYLTSLSFEEIDTTISIFRLSHLKNLKELSIEIKGTFIFDNRPDNLSYLLNLEYLDKLRSLKFIFRSHSKKFERKILKRLSLPKSLESIEFAMTIDSIWDNSEMTKQNRKTIIEKIRKSEIYLNFYNQWKKLKGLKHLCLGFSHRWRIIEGHPEIAGAFATEIIKQIQGLESLKFSYSGLDMIENKTKEALHLKELMRALKSSRKTLKTLEICTKRMEFAEDIYEKFPKLENLYLNGEILPGLTNSFRLFSSKRKQKIKVRLDKLIIDSLQNFETVFESMMDLPKEAELDLEFDLVGLEKKNWWKIFIDEVSHLKSEAKISLSLKNAFIQSVDLLQNIKAVILGNQDLKNFYLNPK